MYKAMLHWHEVVLSNVAIGSFSFSFLPFHIGKSINLVAGCEEPYIWLCCCIK